MSNRISEKQLDALARRINDVTGSPVDTWLDGKGSQIGNYHVSAAYGGFGLHRIVNESGGIRAVTSGYVPKRELWELMRAYLDGITAGSRGGEL